MDLVGYWVCLFLANELFIISKITRKQKVQIQLWARFSQSRFLFVWNLVTDDVEQIMDVTEYLR